MINNRELNQELLDVWGTILGEKMDKAQKEQENHEISSIKYQRLDGYINGICEALSLLQCLEEGRFKKDYERVLAVLKN